MRYGYGADWSYAFHKQFKNEKSSDIESSVTGIAKKIVEGIRGALQRARQEIADYPQERNQIEQELVDRVESLMDSVYRKNPDSDQIIVTQLDGPRGPVYICTENGNHRLASARLIGLKRVRGQVEFFQDGKGPEHWSEFLALLPEESRKEWLSVYEKIYPST